MSGSAFGAGLFVTVEAVTYRVVVFLWVFVAMRARSRSFPFGYAQGQDDKFWGKCLACESLGLWQSGSGFGAGLFVAGEAVTYRVVVVPVGVCGDAGEKQVLFEDDRKKGKGKSRWFWRFANPTHALVRRRA